MQGQTQCTKPLEGELVPWGHPLDVHYSCRGITGWPKLQIQVWGQDMFGRVSILGYGFCHVPASPGMYKFNRFPTYAGLWIKVCLAMALSAVGTNVQRVQRPQGLVRAAREFSYRYTAICLYMY